MSLRNQKPVEWILFDVHLPGQASMANSNWQLLETLVSNDSFEVTRQQQGLIGTHSPDFVRLGA